MSQIGRGLRAAELETIFVEMSDPRCDRIQAIIDELEDTLGLEQKRMGFMVYYGRYMHMDDMGHYWMERHDVRNDWKTDEFRSPQEAIDAGMLMANWDNIQAVKSTFKAAVEAEQEPDDE
jgi:transcription initiation factor TFIID subunit TAF12